MKLEKGRPYNWTDEPREEGAIQIARNFTDKGRCGGKRWFWSVWITLTERVYSSERRRRHTERKGLGIFYEEDYINAKECKRAAVKFAKAQARCLQPRVIERT